jgi:DNA-binding transcriptional MerR regulator
METPLIAQPHPPKLALTREEAAKALGLSAPSIDRLTKRGLLRPSRATRRPLYSVPEIERFLRETTACLTS